MSVSGVDFREMGSNNEMRCASDASSKNLALCSSDGWSHA